jgi:hypothetical protein
MKTYTPQDVRHTTDRQIFKQMDDFGVKKNYFAYMEAIEMARDKEEKQSFEYGFALCKKEMERRNLLSEIAQA